MRTRFYFKAKGEYSFFGQDFIKDELLTESELKKWADKQKNSYVWDFIRKEFEGVLVRGRVYWFFGARFCVN